VEKVESRKGRHLRYDTDSGGTTEFPNQTHEVPVRGEPAQRSHWFSPAMRESRMKCGADTLVRAEASSSESSSHKMTLVQSLPQEEARPKLSAALCQTNTVEERSL
jgi:hypothetical protein